MTREQVIKGLETSLSIGVCGKCVNECWYGDTIASCHDIIQDALALLKPRLLTEADFIDNPNVDSDGCLPAYIEYRRDEEWAEYWEYTKDEWALVRKNNYKAEGYRSWDKRPTKEQMEATPWKY